MGIGTHGGPCREAWPRLCTADRTWLPFSNLHCGGRERQRERRDDAKGEMLHVSLDLVIGSHGDRWVPVGRHPPYGVGGTGRTGTWQGGGYSF